MDVQIEIREKIRVFVLARLAMTLYSSVVRSFF